MCSPRTPERGSSVCGALRRVLVLHLDDLGDGYFNTRIQLGVINRYVIENPESWGGEQMEGATHGRGPQNNTIRAMASGMVLLCLQGYRRNM